jgi:hypothetical protein
MLRPLPFFGAVKMGPLLAWDLVPYVQASSTEVDIFPLET